MGPHQQLQQLISSFWEQKKHSPQLSQRLQLTPTP